MTLVDDGPGKSGAPLRLDAALEAAEDGHVAGLQVRSAVRRDEADFKKNRQSFLQCAGLPCFVTMILVSTS